MRTSIIAGAVTLGLASLPLAAADAGSSWGVGMRASTDQVVAGKTVVFTGTVWPKHAASGRKVVLQEKYRAGKPWVTQKKVTVRGDGTYTVRDTPTSAFTHRYRVVMPGAGHHRRGVSPVRTVSVYKWSPLLLQTAVNNQEMDFGVVDINGKAFQDSVWNRWDTAGSIEFNVNHKCIKLHTVAGLSDTSTVGSQGEVSIESDGAPIYSNTFEIGQRESKWLTLDPAPLKLRVEAHDTSTTNGAAGYGAFGGPEVLCTH